MLERSAYLALIEKAEAKEKRKNYLDAAFLYEQALREHGKKPFVDRAELKKKIAGALSESGMGILFAGTVKIKDGKIQVYYDFSDQGQINDFANFQWNRKRLLENEWVVEDGHLVGTGKDGCIWLGQIKGTLVVEAIVKGVKPMYAQFRFRFYNSGKGSKSTDYCFAFNASDYRGKRKGRTVFFNALGVYKGGNKTSWLKTTTAKIFPSGKPTRVKAEALDETLNMYVDGALIASDKNKKYRKGRFAMQIYESSVAFQEIRITADLDMTWLKRELKKINR